MIGKFVEIKTNCFMMRWGESAILQRHNSAKRKKVAEIFAIEIIVFYSDLSMVNKKNIISNSDRQNKKKPSEVTLSSI